MKPFGYTKAEKLWDTLSVVISLVLAVLGIVVTSTIYNARHVEIYKMREDSTEYYVVDVVPEFREDGITAIINQMYYTKGGHLYVALTFGNGTADMMRADEMVIDVLDGDTKEYIASGYVRDIDYWLSPECIGSYEVYIEPEDVFITDADLENATFEFSITSSIP
jgi:hypothetical protein